MGAFGRLKGPPAVAFLAAVSVAFFLFCIYPRLGRPLAYDEVNFALGGEAVVATGRPFARAGFMEDRGTLDREFQYALWHPPLYVYTLGLAYALFGVGEAQGRLVGVAGTLAAGVLLFFLTRRLTANSWAAVAAPGLFLLHPLTVQSSLLLDIDGSVLLPLFLAAVLAGFDLIARPSTGGLLRAELAFGLALSAKLTTPLAIPPVLGFILVARGLKVQGWGWAGALAFSGAGLFLGLWGTVSLLLGLPFAMPFEVTFAEFLMALGSGLAGTETGWWLSPPLLGLFGWAVGRRARYWAAGQKPGPADFVALLGAVSLGAYLGRTAGYFPKYHIAALPLVIATVVVELAGCLDGLGRRTLAAGFGGAAAGLIAGLALGDGPFFWTVGSYGHPPLVAAGSLLAGLILAALERQRSVPAGVVLGLVAAFAGWAAVTDLIQRSAPYSTGYFYGSAGNVEAARLLDGLLGPGEYYVAAKEVAYYAANRNYIDMYTAYALLARQRAFDGRLLGREIRVWAVFVQDPGLRPFFEAKLGPAYRLAARAEDYAIYVRAERPPD